MVLSTDDVELVQDKYFEMVGKEGKGVLIYVENCFLELTVDILFNVFVGRCQV